MAAISVRIRFPEGQGVLKDLQTSSSLSTLISQSFEVMKMSPDSSECTQILSGFPPKPLEIADKSASLETLGIRSGDTLIFKIGAKSAVTSLNTNGRIFGSENSSSMNQSSSTTSNQTSESKVSEKENDMASSPKQKLATVPDTASKKLKSHHDIVLKRVVVPADNSCLFTSINYSMCGQMVDSANVQFMREIIATTVAGDPVTYNEAFLGKPNHSYCSWILTKDAWGGAIEVQILAEYFQAMIVVLDTQSASLTKFGECGNYDQMLMLIYDGIHYDALCQESPIRKTIFSSNDAKALEAAREFGESQRKAHNFTDTAGFTLKCLVCGHKMKGQKEAQAHAMATKHTNFSEV
uniref:Ubiquitin thioesterase OTU n=1 Tax=Acartia pacifica TaxID=335913 RepID=A0A0U2T7B7_ACAPC|nr:ubiquitin thioesterase OTU1 [Acartia pacifica]